MKWGNSIQHSNGEPPDQTTPCLIQFLPLLPSVHFGAETGRLKNPLPARLVHRRELSVDNRLSLLDYAGVLVLRQKLLRFKIIASVGQHRGYVYIPRVCLGPVRVVFFISVIKRKQLKDQRMHNTPADIILHKDKDGLPRKDDFHYRSLIGQLNYLTCSTRPDIQFATHQCSRFSVDPKRNHEIAVKRIVRYLKRTVNEGITITPDTSQGLKC